MQRLSTEDRLISYIGRGQTVVDCGCGSGEILKMLEGRFAGRIGLEISEHRLQEVRNPDLEGCTVYKADLNQTFPLADGCADAVIANQVIEHLVNPFHFVGEIGRILNGRGRCIITTPNIRYVKTLWKLIFSGYGPRTSGGNTQDGEWDDGHLHYFTHRDLRELFAGSGFHRIESFAFVDLDKGGIVRRVLDKMASSRLVREFLSGSILLYAEK